MTPAPAPDAVDAAWLTAALRRGGVLRATGVVAVEARRVGQGMLGDSVRFALTYDREEGAPASLVGKFASSDPVSRATGADYQLYLKEVRFYQELAGQVAMRTPRPFLAEIDAETSDFVLLLEDLSPARGGDQVTGCTLADAEVAIDQAAALHGPLWGDPSLLDRPWLHTRDADAGKAHAEAFPEYLRLFHGRYDDMLEPEVMAVLEAACAFAPAYRRPPEPPPPTVQHLDYRLDNMLFDARGGADPLAVVDWQSVNAGPGVLDVAYFIGAGLPAEMRRAHERELFARWLDGLARYGVKGYEPDRAWRDYRLHVLQGIFTAVFASVATKRTERGDAMFLTMARRHAAQAIDLDTLKLAATL